MGRRPLLLLALGAASLGLSACGGDPGLPTGSLEPSSQPAASSTPTPPTTAESTPRKTDRGKTAAPGPGDAATNRGQVAPKRAPGPALDPLLAEAGLLRLTDLPSGFAPVPGTHGVTVRNPRLLDVPACHVRALERMATTTARFADSGGHGVIGTVSVYGTPAAAARDLAAAGSESTMRCLLGRSVPRTVKTPAGTFSLKSFSGGRRSQSKIADGALRYHYVATYGSGYLSVDIAADALDVRVGRAQIAIVLTGRGQGLAEADLQALGRLLAGRLLAAERTERATLAG